MDFAGKRRERRKKGHRCAQRRYLHTKILVLDNVSDKNHSRGHIQKAVIVTTESN
jgi:hypothetical protein